MPFTRFPAAAALLLVLCAGVSCDRKPARGKAWSPDSTVDTLQREGTAAVQEGRIEDALAAYQKALALTDRNDDPKGWITLAKSTALMHGALAHSHEAESLLTEALQLSEKLYGQAAQETAETLSQLAMVLRHSNRLAEAEPLIRRALAIDEAFFAKHPPGVAARIYDLTDVLQKTNRSEEAEPLMRRALAINESSFGKDSVPVAASLSHLVQLLKDTNRLAEAEPLQSRYFEIMMRRAVTREQRDAELDKMTNEFRVLRTKMGDTQAQTDEKIAKILAPLQKK